MESNTKSESNNIEIWKDIIELFRGYYCAKSN